MRLPSIRPSTTPTHLYYLLLWLYMKSASLIWCSRAYLTRGAGAFFGAMLTVFFGERLGRKKTLSLGAILMTVHYWLDTSFKDGN